MLVYVQFQPFDYRQTIIIFDEDTEVSRIFASIDELPKRIVDTCYNFNAFEVKFDFPDFLLKMIQEVSIIEASKYSVNKIKFI